MGAEPPGKHPCVRQTTFFGQVVGKNEDHVHGHLPYIIPIVDHTFVWGGREEVKCHMKVLSFVRDVRTFETTPKQEIGPRTLVLKSFTIATRQLILRQNFCLTINWKTVQPLVIKLLGPFFSFQQLSSANTEDRAHFLQRTLNLPFSYQAQTRHYNCCDPFDEARREGEKEREYFYLLIFVSAM